MRAEDVSFHDLSKRLGHSQAQTTVGYYGKIVSNQKLRLLNKVRSHSTLSDKSKG